MTAMMTKSAIEQMLWGVGKEDIRLSKMQTTWKHEYMTNLCLALVVESDGSREFCVPSFVMEDEGVERFGIGCDKRNHLN
ncbi:hypothetical protein F2Q69_00058443 [Brassica cretica]|uniref:Uncharacterized protein n=1 Tax=Brassica cretica TaxID=69181 RepID=A0A8S9RNY3_BRACR|nr:hypothetical protein F2Q69_00058443 [Brassica cretica]